MRFSLWTRGFRIGLRSLRMMSFTEGPAKASLCCDECGEGAPPSYAMYEALKDSCQNNATYFQPDDSENGQRLYQGFMTLIDHIDTVWPLVDHVRKVAPLYDFDSKSPGNGYRSFVSVVDSCVLHGLKLSRQVCTGRDALLFRKGYFVKEIESCSQLLASLGTCLHHLHTLLSWAPPGDLFPLEPHSPEELFSQADTINQYCFYGRCLGFQFLPSMRGILKGISICMAGFSEAYYSHGNLISSVWTGGQYLIDPEMRARRIVNISQSASVEFCKAFWFLAESEIMKRVPSLMSSTVAVNKLITIPPEPITVKTKDGTETTILPPTVHIGAQGLNVRLISVNRRAGMACIDKALEELNSVSGCTLIDAVGLLVSRVVESPRWLYLLVLKNGACIDKALEELNSVSGCTLIDAVGLLVSRVVESPRWLYLLVLKNGSGEGSSTLPPSEGVLFHCHGGGFVAQSSKSHETYLREWAAKLNVPILSIDYSLAPQAPFPRALEEVFYAYCWMLNNFKEIGTTGKRIVFAGDSAGANLIAGCTLKTLSHGLRPPEGLFMAYAPLLVSFIPSPARLLCLMDPLLPFGFMMRCLKAYASPGTRGNRDDKGGIKEILPSNKEALPSNVTTPLDSNGFLKVSTSQEGISEGPSSFEEVSPSDLAELQAHKSGSERERRHSADTTVSAESLQSEHTATGDKMSEPEDLCCMNCSSGTTPQEDRSQQLVSDFLERYVLDSDTDSEGRRIPVIKPNKNVLDESLRSKSQKENESESTCTLVGEPPLVEDDEDVREKKRMKNRLSQAATGIMGAMSSRLAYITGSNSITKSTHIEMGMRSNLDALIARSPSDEFIFSVPRDPLLSPYWADDELLAQFPPVRILTVHLDPCLDDCVMFAKKLKRLGNTVGIDVLEGLPHGFLNFSLMAKEANEGSKLCVERIKQLMDIDSNPPAPASPADNNHL